MKLGLAIIVASAVIAASIVGIVTARVEGAQQSAYTPVVQVGIVHQDVEHGVVCYSTISQHRYERPISCVKVR